VVDCRDVSARSVGPLSHVQWETPDVSGRLEPLQILGHSQVLPLLHLICHIFKTSIILIIILDILHALKGLKVINIFLPW
jgi:hypothetical protein